MPTDGLFKFLVYHFSIADTSTLHFLFLLQEIENILLVAFPLPRQWVFAVGGRSIQTTGFSIESAVRRHHRYPASGRIKQKSMGKARHPRSRRRRSSSNVIVDLILQSLSAQAAHN